jgi:hydrogenase expression/formation protein HypC
MIVSLADDPAHSAVVTWSGAPQGGYQPGRAEGIGPGDWVLIHVGFDMSKIRQQDADEQLRMLTALGETEAAMEEVRGYSTDDGEPSPKERSFP